jgi:hypothetical protein
MARSFFRLLALVVSVAKSNWRATIARITKSLLIDSQEHVR